MDDSEVSRMRNELQDRQCHTEPCKTMGISGRDVHIDTHMHIRMHMCSNLSSRVSSVLPHPLPQCGEEEPDTPRPYMKTPKSSLIWAEISTFNMHKVTAKVRAGAQDEENYTDLCR